MKSSFTQPTINIGIWEEDPLRLVGFQSILEQSPEFHVTSMAETGMGAYRHIQIALLGNHSKRFVQTMDTARIVLPALHIIVTGSAIDDESILKALVAGAKGYVCDLAPNSELIQAIHTVNSGSVWVPRRVMSRFIERTLASTRGQSQFGRSALTSREQDVLRMLVEGRSNKEIGEPLGIEVRTVKAHVSKLMRKVGVTNRIALSMHAFHNGLVSRA
jgi:DNA-binding NarL/FixJ family response regulator